MGAMRAPRKPSATRNRVVSPNPPDPPPLPPFPRRAPKYLTVESSRAPPTPEMSYSLRNCEREPEASKPEEGCSASADSDGDAWRCESTYRSHDISNDVEQAPTAPSPPKGTGSWQRVSPSSAALGDSPPPPHHPPGAASPPSPPPTPAAPP